MNKKKTITKRVFLKVDLFRLKPWLSNKEKNYELSLDLFIKLSIAFIRLPLEKVREFIGLRLYFKDNEKWVKTVLDFHLLFEKELAMVRNNAPIENLTILPELAGKGDDAKTKIDYKLFISIRDYEINNWKDNLAYSDFIKVIHEIHLILEQDLEHLLFLHPKTNGVLQYLNKAFITWNTNAKEMNQSKLQQLTILETPRGKNEDTIEKHRND